MLKRFSLLIILFLLSILPVSAQSDETSCEAIVESAMTTTDNFCADTGRNQACYGDGDVQVTFADEANEASFQTAGDTVDIADVQSLSVGASGDIWSTAIVNLQANLPDENVDQNATLFAFGNVTLTNLVQSVTTLEAIANTGVNVRIRPRGDGQLIGSLTSGQTVITNGRFINDAGETWVRIYFEEHVDRTGWVIGWALSDVDLSALDVVSASSTIVGPMQEFAFTSQSGSTSCSDAPESGIILQSPDGAGIISLNINGLDLTLASTVFMQTTPENVLRINTLQGTTIVNGFNVNQFVPAGTVVQIPLGDDGLIASAPEFPAPYDFSTLQSLPVSVSLPQTVEVAPALAEEEIEAVIAVESGNVPQSGAWVYSVSSNGCGSFTPTLNYNIEATETALTVINPNSGRSLTYGGGNGIYSNTNEGITTTWRVISPTFMEVTGSGSCSFSASATFSG